MNTISKSIMLMVMCIVVALFCLETMIGNIFFHKWWFVAINALCVIANVIFARITYKQAKRKEDYMRHNIQTVMNLQLFDLMRKAFGNHPDAFRNDFGANPKDKDDEMATDK